MTRSTVVLRFTLLFAFVVLTASTAAAITCPQGALPTHYESPSGPEGTFCVEPTQLAYLTNCGTEHCYRFAYTLTAVFPREALSAVNLSIPADGKPCTISILSPTDRSVKVRDYEPSTGFSFLDTNTDLITWDALKLDASNKENIDVYLTQAGSGPQVMELKTGTGMQYVEIDGPICCAETQIETSTCWDFSGTGDCEANGDGSLTVEYDSCTGVPIALSAALEFAPVNAWLCRGFTADTYDSKTCVEIKKLGPRSGAVLYAQDWTFYGFGNRIYKGESTWDPFVEPSACTASGVPSPRVVNYDNLVKVTFDGCGNVESVVDPTTGQLFQEWESLWIGWSDPDGRRPAFFSNIIAGPSNGALIYANPRCFLQLGVLKCY